MEDVIEEIVGEIQDEYDTEEERIQRMADGSLVVDGTMSINDLTQYHNIHFPEKGEFESIGGFLLHRLGPNPYGRRVCYLYGPDFYCCGCRAASY